MKVFVLRIGHRIPRDNRITTHVCLTARALGADGVYISDVHDRELIDTVTSVSKRFGGAFQIETGRPWRSTIRDWKRAGGSVIHLTAYGMPLPKVIRGIRQSPGDKLIVVGAEKVPGDLYELADLNVAVTNQPISEVSALGIFLDWLFEHSRLEASFSNSEIRIVPSEHGKTVVTT
jgi:tRNA (cytidine56-2'-O)-methyltransferase